MIFKSFSNPYYIILATHLIFNFPIHAVVTNTTEKPISTQSSIINTARHFDNITNHHAQTNHIQANQTKIQKPYISLCCPPGQHYLYLEAENKLKCNNIAKSDQWPMMIDILEAETNISKCENLLDIFDYVDFSQNCQGFILDSTDDFKLYPVRSCLLYYANETYLYNNEDQLW